MITQVLLSVGIVISTLIVPVVLIYYLEVRLGAVVERFDDLYEQLEMVFWKLENR